MDLMISLRLIWVENRTVGSSVMLSIASHIISAPHTNKTPDLNSANSQWFLSDRRMISFAKASGVPYSSITGSYLTGVPCQLAVENDDNLHHLTQSTDLLKDV